jgi:predicted phosphoribosyltransferase
MDTNSRFRDRVEAGRLGGVLPLDQDLVARLGIGRHEVERTLAAELRELQRREEVSTPGREPPELEDKTAILVDDGLATGSTMRAPALAVRRLSPARNVAAVPVASPETCEEFRDVVDETVCVLTPRPFHAVALRYDGFSPTSDDEVRRLLTEAA